MQRWSECHLDDGCQTKDGTYSFLHSLTSPLLSTPSNSSQATTILGHDLKWGLPSRSRRCWSMAERRDRPRASDRAEIDGAARPRPSVSRSTRQRDLHAPPGERSASGARFLIAGYGEEESGLSRDIRPSRCRHRIDAHWKDPRMNSRRGNIGSRWASTLPPFVERHEDAPASPRLPVGSGANPATHSRRSSRSRKLQDALSGGFRRQRWEDVLAAIGPGQRCPVEA